MHQKSDVGTIPRADSAAAAHSMQIFATFIDPEHRAGEENQLDNGCEGERLGLEDALQERQVDDTGLAG